MNQQYDQKVSGKYITFDESHKATLDLRYYGFTEKDLDEEVFIDMPSWGGLLGARINGLLEN